MMRNVVVSARVGDKLDDLMEYLENDLKFSEEAMLAYRKRFLLFLTSLGGNVDYALCRFRRWRMCGYRCAVFEKGWVIAYENVEGGVIVRDMMHGKLLVE
jgi:plasmid stabilization system protein ParE